MAKVKGENIRKTEFPSQKKMEKTIDSAASELGVTLTEDPEKLSYIFI